MATLQEIFGQRPQSADYVIKHLDTDEEKTVSHIQDGSMYFTDGAILPLTEDRWEIKGGNRVSGKVNASERRGWVEEFFLTFEAKNIDNVKDAVWPETHIDEIANSAEMAEVFKLRGTGMIKQLRSRVNALTTNTTWLKDVRKNKLLEDLDLAIAECY